MQRKADINSNSLKRFLLPTILKKEELIIWQGQTLPQAGLEDVEKGIRKQFRDTQDKNNEEKY